MCTSAALTGPYELAVSACAAETDEMMTGSPAAHKVGGRRPYVLAGAGLKILRCATMPRHSITIVRAH